MQFHGDILTSQEILSLFSKKKKKKKSVQGLFSLWLESLEFNDK